MKKLKNLSLLPLILSFILILSSCTTYVPYKDERYLRYKIIGYKCPDGYYIHNNELCYPLIDKGAVERINSSVQTDTFKVVAKKESVDKSKKNLKKNKLKRNKMSCDQVFEMANKCMVE